MQATKKTAPDMPPPTDTAYSLRRRAKDTALTHIAQLLENSQALALKTPRPVAQVFYDGFATRVEPKVRDTDPRRPPTKPAATGREPKKPVAPDPAGPRLSAPDDPASLKAIKERSAAAMFVILAGSGEPDSARDIYRFDAEDLSLKPCGLNDLLVQAAGSPEEQSLLRQLARRTRLLEEEIRRLKQTEMELRCTRSDLEKRLEDRAATLHETDIALNVLLKKREADKQTLEGYVMANIERLVEPVLTRLEESRLTDQQQVLVDILRSNLKELTSPFADTFSTKLTRLTPAEIQIANLVKLGKRTKEIAKILHLSAGTISIHRKNIRKKLNLTHQKTNLQSLLTSSL